MYWHAKLGVNTLVHGDDFASVGRREGIRQLREKLENIFELRTKVIGTGEGESVEGKVLNRVIRVSSEGWEYEPDQRHAEIIIAELGLNDAKAVASAGDDEHKWEEQENAAPLSGQQSSRFRSIAARVNYLSADRPDLMYSAKEACRQMAHPTEG